MKKLCIRSRRARGMFGYSSDYCPPPPIHFPDFRLNFYQNGLRTISIETDVDRSFEDLLHYALNLVKLNQIGEGYFQQITHFCGYENIEDKEPCTKKTLEELKSHGLIDFYNTFDNFISGKLELVAPYEILSNQIYEKWVEIYSKLTIQHNAFLYFSADNSLPIDLRFANIIELCEPIAIFLLEEGYLPNGSKDDTRCLKGCLNLLINNYGYLVFRKEINANLFDENIKYRTSIAQKLVNARVNILHYKLDPKETVGKKAELIIYCNKMHLLYRLTILSILGITVSHKRTESAVQYLENGMLPFDFEACIASYKSPR